MTAEKIRWIQASVAVDAARLALIAAEHELVLAYDDAHGIDETPSHDALTYA